MSMNFIEEYAVSITTDASGDSTDNPEQTIFGLLYAVYVDQGTLSDGAADITISYTNRLGESVTLLTLTNVTDDKMYYPRELLDDNAGADLSGVYDPALIAGKVTVTTAQGGNAKSGNVILYVITS